MLHELTCVFAEFGPASFCLAPWVGLIVLQPNKTDSLLVKGLSLGTYFTRVTNPFNDLVRILRSESELDITSTERTGECMEEFIGSGLLDQVASSILSFYIHAASKLLHRVFRWYELAFRIGPVGLGPCCCNASQIF